MNLFKLLHYIIKYCRYVRLIVVLKIVKCIKSNAIIVKVYKKLRKCCMIKVTLGVVLVKIITYVNGNQWCVYLYISEINTLATWYCKQ